MRHTTRPWLLQGYVQALLVMHSLVDCQFAPCADLQRRAAAAVQAFEVLQDHSKDLASGERLSWASALAFLQQVRPAMAAPLLHHLPSCKGISKTYGNRHAALSTIKELNLSQGFTQRNACRHFIFIDPAAVHILCGISQMMLCILQEAQPCSIGPAVQALHHLPTSAAKAAGCEARSRCIRHLPSAWSVTHSFIRLSEYALIAYAV